MQLLSLNSGDGAPARPSVLLLLRRGSWTVLDQGLFAGSNFVVNVLLARWLVPEAYGAFTVAFAVFLLLGTFHTGFLSEPMLVFGSGRFLDRLGDYFRALLRGHAGFSALAALVLGAAAAGAWLFGDARLAVDLGVLALAQPFLLLLWLARRACYIRLQPQVAASGGLLYMVLMLAGVAALQHARALSVATAFALMSASSLLAAGWIGWRLRVRPLGAPAGPLVREAVGQHWQYGRWAAATGGVGWVYGYLSFLVLPAFGGLEASASLKAIMNLILPAAHVYAALSSLLVPMFVRAREGGRLRATATLALAAITAAMMGYWVVLGMFGEPVMEWLYGGSYTHHAGLLWLAGSIPVLGGALATLSAVLRAQERPNLIFWANVGAAVAAVTAGVGLIWGLGLTGALLFHLLTDAVAAGLVALFLLRPAPAPPAPTPDPNPAPLVAEPAAP